ncbi:hypothetical protein [Corynebacterium confusum]|uniref:hypothetical protein n=1 Tax=Corynebacterium confusum TaxID=71254 RepID=UPI0025B5D4FA|nr:hypothetical protein [Corynebacterium confusum]
MHAFFSWLTSQSGVSLLVALIALGGVLINNRAAEKRRRADQEAADQRRKDDQAAEDARRKADDDRRERERRAQLQREDWERQRRAVADCISGIFTASKRVQDAVTQFRRERIASTELVLVEKATALSQFYLEAETLLNRCDLEVTQPHVSEQITNVWVCIEHDQKELDGDGEARSGDVWLAKAKKLKPLSEQTLKEIRELTIVARLSLLEYPEHMAEQPVVPIDDKNDN